MRAAAKYGRVVAHVAMMFRHLEAKGDAFELEVSVDGDRDAYLARRARLHHQRVEAPGVRSVSLAPLYVGRFEKCIDYLGDLQALQEDLSGHAAIARALGPYKLSFHSGSDKFSVYSLINEATGGAVYLKTAGTSYLEALRVIARLEPGLFRRIGALAREGFETDRVSYHVPAQLEKVPDFGALSNAKLPDLLDQDDAGQVLHVTFGSTLDAFKEEIVQLLEENEEAHYEGLAQHFKRHLTPFARSA